MSRDDESGRAAYEAEVIGMGLRAVGEARMTQTPHPAQAVITSPVIADHVVFAAFAQVVGQLPNAQERDMALAFAKLILAAAVPPRPIEPAPKPPRAWEGPSRAIPGAGPDLSVHRQVAWGEPPKEDTV